MTYKPGILAFAGSTRKDSYNKKLARIAAKIAAKAGADVTYIDLKDYPLPLYDADLEEREGIPEKAIQLKHMFKNCDGLIIASPEYNSSLSGVLKNTLDWISRPVEGETILECFNGKTAVILSASPGRLGGLRGLSILRQLLNNIYINVLPDQVTISKANTAFDENDELISDNKQQQITELVEKLINTLIKLNT